MDKIAKFLKDNYGLTELPTEVEIQKWYSKTIELKNKGLRSDTAAQLAAHSMFEHMVLEEKESFEVRTTTDDIETILAIIKEKIK